MNDTRAVLRAVEPANGNPEAYCDFCKEPVRFAARKKRTKVVVNVYDSGVWSHVLQFHGSCYEQAGQPFGEAVA